jgi:hypothetical protein
VTRTATQIETRTVKVPGGDALRRGAGLGRGAALHHGRAN